MNQANSNSGDASGLGGVLPAGSKVGKYVIRQQVGSGGQAIVYKAHDPALDRDVAIMQVSPALAADPRFVERFREVARQVARLDCEQLVTIHDLIDDGQGRLCVVMEFVEGHTIETTLATQPGPVELKAALQVIWRIAAGLAALHRAGIVHRDVKPGNIIVGEGLRVKITDFGVAARIGANVSMKLGTTKYMAPELFSGARVDGRSDLYSLGMIAYEMLLGRERFNEVFKDIVRDPHSEALRWMRWHSAPEAATPLHELDSAIPAALSAIVGKMMAKKADDRFPNMEALGRELKQTFSPRPAAPARHRRKGKGRPVAVEPTSLGNDNGEELAPTPAEPLTAAIPKKPMARRTKVALAAVSAGTIIVVAAALMVQSANRQRETRQEAERAYASADSIFSATAKEPYYKAALEDFSARYAQAEALLTKGDTGAAELAYRRAFGVPLALLEVKETDSSRPAGYEAALTGMKAEYARGMAALGKLAPGLDSQPVKAAFGAARAQVEAAYQAGGKRAGYKTAQEGFQHARELAGAGPVAWQATIMGKYAQAQLAAAVQDWEEASRMRLAAKADIDRLQQTKLSNLSGWAGQLEAELSSFESTMNRQRQYLAGMAKAEHEAEGGNFDAALKTLADEVQKFAAAPEENARIQSLRDTIDVTQKLGEFEKHVRAGLAARAQQDFAGARKEFELAKAVLDKAGETISPNDADRMRKVLEGHVNDVKVDEAYSMALMRADAAVKEGNWLAAAAALEEALQAKPGDPDKLAKRIKEARQKHYLIQFREHLAAGRLKQAEEALRQAQLALDNETIAGERAELQRMKDYRRLVWEGDQFMSSKKYEPALEKYQAAAKLPLADADLRAKVDDAQFYLYLLTGDTARAAKKWDDARAAYNQAKALRPNDNQVDARLALVEQLCRYEALLGEAQALRQQGKFSDAYARVLEARKVMDTPEATDLLHTVRYEQYLAEGDKAMQAGDYAAAVAHYGLAKGEKSTPEVAKKLREATRLREDKERESSGVR